VGTEEAPVMTELADPLAILRRVMVALQRARSVSAETLGDEDVLAMVEPWLARPMALLPRVAELVDRAESTGQPPSNHDVFNILVVLRTVKGGQLGARCDIVSQAIGEPDIPHDPMEWFRRAMGAADQR
jgi:hypothetical protein